jgi:hypothetical protein
VTRWWLLDTGWACGGVATRAGVIVDGAPIFRRLLGQRFAAVVLAGHYRYEAI